MSMNFVNEPTRAWDPKNRLREMINEGSDAANVDKLVELLIMDGFDFSLTADAMTESQKLFAEASMNGFVAKPIDMVQMVRVLLQWLPKELIKEKESSGK